MIRFGLPLTLSSLGGMLLTMGDRYILKIYSPLTEVGQYTLGYKFASVVNLVFVQAIQLAWPAIAWKKIKEPNAKRFISKILTYYSFVIIWAVLAISLFAEGIIHKLALNQSYWASSKIVPIIALSYALNGIYFLVGFIFHYKNKTQYLPLIVILSTVLNIGLNFIFIPSWGMEGAAIATLISYFMMSILTYKFAQKFYTINYELRKIVLLLIISIRIILKFVLILSFPLMFLPFNFYEKIELQRIKEYLRKKIIRTK